MELRHVVAAADQSAAGRHAVLVAARLAERGGARLSVISVRLAVAGRVLPDPPADAADQQAKLPDLGRGLEVGLRQAAPGTEPEFTTLDGVPGVEIPRFAEEHAGDLLVLGRKHRSQRQRMFLGDTADAVARRSQVPCLFVGPDRERLEPILACLDSTERSATVLRAATELARLVGGRIKAVTVEPVWLNEPDELASALPASRTLRLIRTLDRRLLANDLRVRRGNVVTELLAEAVEADAGILAFGYHRGGPPGILEGGSVARGLLHSARCAVLTVPL